MAGPARKQRKPTISKPTGLHFQSLGENRSNEENKNKVGKVQTYKPKKKVILLPGKVLGEE
jgi:hypothetical protein